MTPDTTSIVEDTARADPRPPERPRRFLVVFRVGAVALAALLVAVIARGSSGAPLEVGVEAPRVRGKQIAGAPFSAAALKGRPVVVNIWASWCAPCRIEMPDLIDAAAHYAERVTFIGLVAESAEADAKAVAEQLRVPYPVALIDDATQHAWNAVSFPSTYVLDQNGRVAWSSAGLVRRSELDAALAPLLASSTR